LIMMALIAAAALAAQTAPAANPHAQMQHGQTAPMQHEQHEGTKKDCCKECCKDMAGKEHGERAEHGSSHAGH
jgi:hypothetical protein